MSTTWFPCVPPNATKIIIKKEKATRKIDNPRFFEEQLQFNAETFELIKKAKAVKECDVTK